MTSKFLGKTGTLRYPLCSHCALPCKDEQYKFDHTFKDSSEEEKVVKKVFCSLNCIREEMGIEEHILEEVEGRTRKELNWLHKQICPSCKRRIASAV